MPSSGSPSRLRFDAARVLFDGDGLVAVDKPPWLTTQRTRATSRLSLEAALRELLGDASLVAAHRLDRQTSGATLFARGSAGAWVSHAFAARRVAKRYLAVVTPPPERAEFAVEGWMARAPDPARFRFALHPAQQPGSRWSSTRFGVIERGERRALVEANPETGRTHQIRVHLAAAGAPIVGDDLYGAAAAERVLLHAAELSLLRPDGAPLRVEAPVPADIGEPAQIPRSSTGSPTRISPGVSTRHETPPRQSGTSAARRPGCSASITRQGVVSSLTSSTSAPTLSLLPTLPAKATPSTSRFARRSVHGSTTPSSRQAASHASCESRVTALFAGCERSPGRPSAATGSAACSAIGARVFGFVAIASSTPGRAMPASLASARRFR